MTPLSEASESFEVAMAPVLQACSRSGASSSAAGRATIEAVHAAADSLHVELTKVAVLLGGGNKPSHREACSVLEAAKQRFAAVCALLHGRVDRGAGPSLRAATAAVGRGLLQACQALLGSLSRPAEAEQVPQKVGIIKERCTAVMRAPQDNQAAIGRQLVKIARQVGDALREARELVQSAATEGDDTAAVNAGHQANGHASTLTSSAAESDAAAHHSSSQADGSADAAVTASAYAGGEGAEMMVFEGEQLTPSELAIAQAAEKVVTEVLNLLLALIRALSKMEPLGPDLETWESLVFHCRTLETSTNDLVADLFGPQDPESVASAANAVMTGAELIIEELPSDFLLEPRGRAFDLVREALSFACVRMRAQLDAMSQASIQLSVEE